MHTIFMDYLMILLCAFYSLNDNPTSPFAFHESKQAIIVQTPEKHEGRK